MTLTTLFLCFQAVVTVGAIRWIIYGVRKQKPRYIVEGLLLTFATVAATGLLLKLK
jgi:hypothetical protein